MISRNLITTINAKDISTLDVTNADITADPRCAGLALSVKTSKMFMLKNSSIVGTYGAIQISGTASSPAQAMIIDTTVSNSGIASTVDSGPAILTIIGGKIFNNMSASQFRDGKVTLKNVRIEANGGNGSSAIYVSGSSAQSLASLVMRGCTVVNNRYGIAMFDYSAADLGTDADPGNNVFQDNQLAGVTLGGIAGPQLVNAVGNTWNPMTQGSDALGKYPVPGTVAGPIQQATGNNYDMWAGLSLRR
ncbi:MAG: hypothetical protein E6J90_34100 [Deltaproteobacteria bacterium]|nr:MAG: hypothetical protein E6J90_34100 [Deltaproteobacteria bacterium]